MRRLLCLILARMRCYAMIALCLSCSACVANETEHPPNVECDGEGCVGPSVGRSSGSGKGTGGTGGGASSSDAGQASAVTVNGEIVEVDEPSFSVSRASSAGGVFTLRAPGASGSDVTAEVTPSFTLDGLLVTKTLWIAAKPATNSDLYAGISALDSTQVTQVVVPVVRASTLQLVASVLPMPVILDKTKAQVVLRFVDDNGEPLSGISVASSGAETVAYDEGASYTNDRKVTGSRGLAFLLNVDASATPSARQVSVSGTRKAVFAVWVQSSAATALELTVSP